MPAPKGNNFAKGNKGGRPPMPEAKKVELFEKMFSDFQSHLQNFDTNKSPIFIEAWARDNKIPYRTLLSYAEANEEFLHTYKECKQIQKELLIQGGLKGYFNPTAFIFTAKNITDMRDKVETENVNTIKFENLEAIQEATKTILNGGNKEVSQQ